MDPQIASQFLGTLTGLAGTILAAYVAVVMIIVQDREIFQELEEHKELYWLIGATCAVFGIAVLHYLWQFLILTPQNPLPQLLIFVDFFIFVIGIALLLLNVGTVILMRIRGKQKKEDPKQPSS